MLHGGEIYNSIEVRYDFSVNVNPLGIPENVLRSLQENLSLLTQYPDQECRELRLALEKFTGIPSRQILCGNGASELIEAAVRGLQVSRILLTAPSFSGYRHAAQSHGCEILYHALRREENFALTDRYLEDLARKPDLAILCSPSNPIGDRIDPDLLCRIAETCERQGTWLMVDECFLGFLPDEDQRTMRRFLVPTASFQQYQRLLVPTASFQQFQRLLVPSASFQQFQRLLVLDAFTKRFAMPGIRLGYLMAADPDVLEMIHAQQPEWSVSIPAQIAGLAALETGREYMETARALAASERARMAAVLEKLGCRVFPGEANYIFFSCKIELYEPLLQRGILIRRCDNYPGLEKGDYRVAVLRPEENQVLAGALTEIITAGS
ncbi:MAG: histidinol-phosphate transaminase [Eubacteriales bacterium]|nr:histidinol-phosphate transaminase [Eubacteriales bacterium]